MALTVKKIAKLGKGRHHDGGGLYLQVMPPALKKPKALSSRSWVLRYNFKGTERWLGLGAWPAFSLEEARYRARKAKQQIADGVDPISAKQAEAAKRIDFETAATDYFEGHQQKWSNAEHRRQFLSTLQEYAFPKIGKRLVAAIDTSAILEVLKPIWYDKTVTAGRVTTTREVHVERGTGIERAPRGKEPYMLVELKSDGFEYVTMRNAVSGRLSAAARAFSALVESEGDSLTGVNYDSC
jgi:hypothetical protein